MSEVQLVLLMMMVLQLLLIVLAVVNEGTRLGNKLNRITALLEKKDDSQSKGTP